MKSECRLAMLIGSHLSEDRTCAIQVPYVYAAMIGS
jgi:hypothetical protein